MSAGIVLNFQFSHASHSYFHLEFDGTNNMVKYGFPLDGFELAKGCDIKLLNIIGDSNLIRMQVKEKFSYKNERSKRYKDVVHLAMGYFIAISL